MAHGIYIYTEIQNRKSAPYTAELISLAESLQMDETIHVFGLEGTDIFYEQEAAEIIADYIRKEDPMIILVPAIGTAKAIFSRVAAMLDIGMTADCTELYIENGIFKQKKPAFGNEVMVVTEERDEPALVTVVIGGCNKSEKYPTASVTVLKPEISGASTRFLGISEQNTEEIIDAETILAVGRGVLDNHGYQTAVLLAKKIGAAIGGTRPLVDQGVIPFEHQIGQTGCVVHPKCCIFVGVSGAIQHTEGVRDTNVKIAINNDPNAAIFSFADYGIVADGNEFMNKLMEKL
ncbi:MAG: electron transfer flavoprotein subunit alpha/FixB family protein [Lachnospiraceae bacterium]|nr:electron transfer flavoprotein subunit alpha/FixB family protein [Lachnospiraceae bacterium]